MALDLMKEKGVPLAPPKQSTERLGLADRVSRPVASGQAQPWWPMGGVRSGRISRHPESGTPFSLRDSAPARPYKRVLSRV